uniref:Uncharacterized protein n=1 Tax=Anguilla anguilla TaxID=7936 RepID=A0A0E9PLV8_ANGAN
MIFSKLFLFQGYILLCCLQCCQCERD